MKANTEEKRKRKLHDGNYVSAADISHSISSSVLAVISASISAKEMTSSRYFKFGARPKWTAQHAPSQPCPNCGDTTIPPWRDKSLWRITTTKTAEGLLSKNPSYRSKKKVEGLWSMPNCSRKMKKSKKWSCSQKNETKEEVEGRIKDWRSRFRRSLSPRRKQLKDYCQKIRLADPRRRRWKDSAKWWRRSMPWSMQKCWRSRQKSNKGTWYQKMRRVKKLREGSSLEEQAWGEPYPDKRDE